jgi:hypothetical protein
VCSTTPSALRIPPPTFKIHNGLKSKAIRVR